MFDIIVTDSALWAATLTRARRELVHLPPPERAWLAAQVDRIGRLQQELDHLFHAVDGRGLCAKCQGGCCGQARHHATLTNLLGYLLGGEEPPTPDFSRECPFLATRGCRLPAARRPFKCIIFLCEALDQRLTGPQRQAFVAAERELRAAYAAVAARCPGASLHGLLLAAARLGDRPLLTNDVRP